MADRVPGEARFLSAEWRYLLMLNYAVDPAALLPMVPAGTELDFFEGRALFSLVGFRFLRTRVMGVAIPFHCHFEEINLRFYVRRKMPTEEIRRGVVFVRELVPRLAVAVMARLFYNEPYRACRMRSEVPGRLVDSPGRIGYGWRTRRGWEEISATTSGAATIRAADSEATFITEHYWGYTRQRDGGTVEYRVMHPQWRVWEAEEAACSGGVGAFYGEPFGAAI
jgi:uncharacterized protein YqjF (DUF2071 family)